MPPRKLIFWTLAIVALFAAKSAEAGAISYGTYASGGPNHYLLFDADYPFSFQGPAFTLPDPNAGGTVAFGSIYGRIAPAQPDSYAPFQTIPYHTGAGLTGEFTFDLQGHDAAGHLVGPDVTVKGLASLDVRQVTVGDEVVWSLSSFTAAATRVWCPDGDPVPAALQGLADNPGRIRLTMQWPVGVAFPIVDLTIAPAPVPEPSTLATMLSALGLAWAYRAKRPRSGSRSQG